MNTARAMKEASQFRLHGGLGILFAGDDGWVLVGREFIAAEPESLLKTQFKSDQRILRVSTNHRRNFLDCVKNRQPTITGIETAVRTDTICHLDDIAMRLGHKLHWDPTVERFIGNETANRMLVRPMRSPWRL